MKHFNNFGIKCMLINRVNSSRTSSTQTPIRLQFVNQSQFIKKIVAKIA